MSKLEELRKKESEAEKQEEKAKDRTRKVRGAVEKEEKRIVREKKRAGLRRCYECGEWKRNTSRAKVDRPMSMSYMWLGDSSDNPVDMCADCITDRKKVIDLRSKK